MVRVKNIGRRYVGEDGGKPLVIEAGAEANVSDEKAADLRGLPFEFPKAVPAPTSNVDNESGEHDNEN